MIQADTPRADTPMPGEDPGALVEDEDRLDEIEPAPVQPPPRIRDETPGVDEPERQRS